jgi:hypothetical protein
MAATIFTVVLGASIAAFFIWTAENGRRADREREWGKRD